MSPNVPSRVPKRPMLAAFALSFPAAPPSARSQQAAVVKINELSSLEQRLRDASMRARSAGFRQRARSYVDQAAAVRRERERWTILASKPTPPAPIPHLFAACLCVVLPMIDLFVAGGHAARRLSRAVFSVGLFVCGVVVSSTSSSAWSCEQGDVSTPEHWVTEFAQRELDRKAQRKPWLFFTSPRQVHSLEGFRQH